MPEVDDVKSCLNLTPVREVLRPRTLDEVCAVLGRARDEGLSIVEFMAVVRADCAARGTDMTYGTIRRIERDEDSFLAWATEPWLCIVCNLHVRHTEEGPRRAREEFQLVIDRAIEHGGTFCLTYHRWARPDQLAACYPRMREFLRLKRRFDPRCIVQSDWWRH